MLEFGQKCHNTQARYMFRIEPKSYNTQENYSYLNVQARHLFMYEICNLNLLGFFGGGGDDVKISYFI